MISIFLSSSLSHFIKFNDEELAVLKEVALVRNFKKKEVILPFGEKELYISCVAKGLVRKHIMNGDRSISTEFAAEGEVICSNSSFGSHMPSEYSTEAIENTTLISFTLSSLEKLYRKSHVFFEFGKIIVSKSLLKGEEREIMLMKYDAQRRLEYLMEKKSDLFLRLPQNMIASYLNIQPETFSKLKRNILNKSV